MTIANHIFGRLAKLLSCFLEFLHLGSIQCTEHKEARVILKFLKAHRSMVLVTESERAQEVDASILTNL